MFSLRSKVWPVLLCSCGAMKGSKAGQPQDPEGVVAVPVVSRAAEEGADAGTPAKLPPTLPSGPVLTGGGRLERLFRSLSLLEQSKLGRDLVILQYGDSHTAADMMTGPFRRQLQEAFGDGGRGFVPLGMPWKYYRQEGIFGSMSGFTQDRGIRKGKYEGDGLYGLGGFALTATKKGAVATTNVKSAFSSFELAFLEQEHGGSFEVRVDDVVLGKVKTRAKKTASGFQTFKVESEAPHKLEVRALGDGPVRIFGARIEKANHGIEVDTLGINGARFIDTLRWEEPHMAQQWSHRSPDLVMLAYGTNESVDDLPIETHSRGLVEFLGRLSRAVPSSNCLIIGPPDRVVRSDDESGMKTPERLLRISEFERRVAEAAGCAYFDTISAMGGPGAMQRWVEEEKPQLGQKDYIHLSMPGYELIGRKIADELARAYGDWKTTQIQASVEVPKIK